MSLRSLSSILLFAAACGEPKPTDDTGVDTPPEETGDTTGLVDSDTAPAPDTEPEWDSDTGPIVDSEPEPVEDLDGDGWTEDDGDCDDADATVFPGAEELCGDGVANDCLATIDEAEALCVDLDLGSALVEYRGEAFDDQAGRSARAVGDIDGDGVIDLVIGAPHVNIATGSGDPGRAYLVYGGDTGVVGLGSVQAELVGERDYDSAGLAVAGVGDVSGDGMGDFLVGAPAFNPGTYADAGAVYLVHGGVAGRTPLAASAARLLGSDNNANAGCALDGGGDLDGDDQPDFVVGAYYGARGNGAVFVYTEPPTGEAVLEASAPLMLTGTPYSFAGGAVAIAGDTDGDGIDDLIVGALADSTRGTYAGAAYLVLGGSLTGTVSLASADLSMFGAVAYDYAGAAVSGAGDCDGDGLVDLLVGATAEHTVGVQAGAAYLVHGGTVGTMDLGSVPLQLLGEQAYAYAGQAVAAGGDVDGDGVADVVVGATGQDTGVADSGAVYIVPGDTTGTHSLGTMGRVDGLGRSDYLGASLDGLGDVDGDGLDDLLIGAHGRTTSSAAPGAGAAFVLLGSGI